ncbi:MAG: response regulator [Candidatus Omnitrophica bacterium]|nr:response regulator [Candidatus Omnitrophota bacterium]
MTKKRKKILVVDDNPVTQRLYGKIFANAGYDVVEAFGGQECFAKINATLPDVIVMDVILPDGDGKVIVEQLNAREAAKDIPVIFVTNTLSPGKDKGYETIEINGKIYRAFAKPVHVAKLLSVVRKEYNRTRHGGQPTPKLTASRRKAEAGGA